MTPFSEMSRSNWIHPFWKINVTMIGLFRITSCPFAGRLSFIPRQGKRVFCLWRRFDYQFSTTESQRLSIGLSNHQLQINQSINKWGWNPKLHIRTQRWFDVKTQVAVDGCRNILTDGALMIYPLNESFPVICCFYLFASDAEWPASMNVARCINEQQHPLVGDWAWNNFMCDTLMCDPMF